MSRVILAPLALRLFARMCVCLPTAPPLPPALARDLCATGLSIDEVLDGLRDMEGIVSITGRVKSSEKRK